MITTIHNYLKVTNTFIFSNSAEKTLGLTAEILKDLAEKVINMYKAFNNQVNDSEIPEYSLCVFIKVQKLEKSMFELDLSSSRCKIIFIIGDNSTKRWLDENFWEGLRKNKQVIFLHFPLSKNTPEHWREQLSKK